MPRRALGICIGVFFCLPFINFLCFFVLYFGIAGIPGLPWLVWELTFSESSATRILNILSAANFTPNLHLNTDWHQKSDTDLHYSSLNIYAANFTPNLHMNTDLHQILNTDLHQQIDTDLHYSSLNTKHLIILPILYQIYTK